MELFLYTECFLTLTCKRNISMNPFRNLIEDRTRGRSTEHVCIRDLWLAT